MKTAYLFDVDGTLTPSRQHIDPEFKEYMMAFSKTHDVYIVTGSDKPKTVEQIDEDLYNSAIRAYNCGGNDVWEGEDNIYTDPWTLPEEPWKFLETRLIHSKWGPKTGHHFDVRPGMVNFSILGRNATLEQRHAYVEYDKSTQERRLLADEFNSYFSDKYNIEGTLGGETGIDIAARGKDKGQILKDFDAYDDIVFFGDRTEPGGNDYALAKLIIETGRGYVFQIDHWVTTYKTLLNIE